LRHLLEQMVELSAAVAVVVNLEVVQPGAETLTEEVEQPIPVAGVLVTTGLILEVGMEHPAAQELECGTLHDGTACKLFLCALFR
jgi:hypothetical protein